MTSDKQPVPAQATRIKLVGVVQGLGVRPTIWRVANRLGLVGTVLNDGAGVQIDVIASAHIAQQLLAQVKAELPPLARIDQAYFETIILSTALAKQTGFDIVASEATQVTTGCVPDLATCSACLKELFEPNNRRYHYPFINCTHCGPRLSIIEQIPYDRGSTTMRHFKMCGACDDEYTQPADRRFHAQPNACKDCGPRLWLEHASGEEIRTDQPFDHLRQRLLQGEIIALKGLGGFHLVCDATQTSVVNRLRTLKHRPAKPFALMAGSLAAIAEYAQLNGAGERLLTSPQAPVVLLDNNASADKNVRPLAAGVAPSQRQLGFMLPYTPIHWLLFEGLDRPLVMTSGNRAGMPQAISNDDAREQLADIADVFVMHNRDIHNRVDDSVVKMVAGQPQLLRRARGYAPESHQLPQGFDAHAPLLALGAEVKNTFCLAYNQQLVTSQHIGDLTNVHTYQALEQSIALYQNLYQTQVTHFVCDKHPNYLSSQLAEQLAQAAQPAIRVQHHHAHFAACLGDNDYPLNGKPVLGICIDGTGFGDDETLWGGEFLYGGYASYKRIAHLRPFPLIGAALAIKEPWRCLYAQLVQAFPNASDQDLCQHWPVLSGKPLATLRQMMAKGLNSPQTSSLGRLFDAVAAALGCSAQAVSYEGQAAIELENLALASAGVQDDPAYTLTLTHDNQLCTQSLWQALASDLAQGRPKADIALAFHRGVVEGLVASARLLSTIYPFSHVALSGGVMQNSIIHTGLVAGFKSHGFSVLTHQRLPANDGCIAYGQALVALGKV
ncbi:MAG: carbamoyltransferase HypF [Pontibacterium sp.]